jgi:WD40 repeat protein
MTGERVRVWDLVNRRERLAFDYPGIIDTMAFTPDNRMMALGGGEVVGQDVPRTIRLWELASGKERASLTGHKTGLVALAFSPDGQLLASGGDDGFLKVWDMKLGAELFPPGERVGGITSLSFSPDGKTLAVGSYDTTVRLFTIAR